MAHPSLEKMKFYYCSFDFFVVFVFTGFGNKIQIDKQLEVIWNDNHTSKYDFDWLFERNFTAENRQRYLTTKYRPPMDLWSKQQFKLEEFQVADVLGSDEGTFDDSKLKF